MVRFYYNTPLPILSCLFYKKICDFYKYVNVKYTKKKQKKSLFLHKKCQKRDYILFKQYKVVLSFSKICRRRTHQLFEHGVKVAQTGKTDFIRNVHDTQVTIFQ